MLLLQNLVHILTLRLKEMRESKVLREMTILNLGRWQGQIVISGLKTAFHDINVTVSNIFLAINKLGTAMACFSNEMTRLLLIGI